MDGKANNSPMLKAASLWSKTSVKGGWYLTGRLGGVKVLVMENRDRKSDDDPSHHLFFVEAPDRRQGGQQGAQERGPGLRAGATGGRPSGAAPPRWSGTGQGCLGRRAGVGEVRPAEIFRPYKNAAGRGFFPAW